MEKTLLRSVIQLLIITGFILLIPLAAMQFSAQVNWTPGDFIFAGALIFGTGFVYKLITLKNAERIYRIAVGMTCATGFLLVWANAAVGIIGTENNPVNMLYFGVLLIGFFGAIITRFQPKGMSFALFGTALAHTLATATVLIGNYYDPSVTPVMEIVILNGFFIMLWTGSGFMFRYASVKNLQSETKHAY